MQPTSSCSRSADTHSPPDALEHTKGQMGSRSVYDLKSVSTDLLISIFDFLSTAELVPLTRVCKAWKKALDDHTSWATLLKEWPQLPCRQRHIDAKNGDSFSTVAQSFARHRALVWKGEVVGEHENPSIFCRDLLYSPTYLYCSENGKYMSRGQDQKTLIRNLDTPNDQPTVYNGFCVLEEDGSHTTPPNADPQDVFFPTVQAGRSVAVNKDRDEIKVWNTQNCHPIQQKLRDFPKGCLYSQYELGPFIRGLIVKNNHIGLLVSDKAGINHPTTYMQPSLVVNDLSALNFQDKWSKIVGFEYPFRYLGSQHPASLIQFSENAKRIYAIGWGKIKAWDTCSCAHLFSMVNENGKLLQSCNCLEVVGNWVIAGCDDGIRVWDAHTTEGSSAYPNKRRPLHVLKPNREMLLEELVPDLLLWIKDLPPDLTISALPQPILRLIDGTTLFLLSPEHTPPLLAEVKLASVTYLTHKDDKLISGHDNGIIRIWDLNLFQCQLTLRTTGSNTLENFLQLDVGIDCLSVSKQADAFVIRDRSGRISHWKPNCTEKGHSNL